MISITLRIFLTSELHKTNELIKTIYSNFFRNAPLNLSTRNLVFPQFVGPVIMQLKGIFSTNSSIIPSILYYEDLI